MRFLKIILIITSLILATIVAFKIWNTTSNSSKGLVILKVRVPDNTPENAALTLGGSFNGWDPHTPGYAFTQQDTNSYEYRFAPLDVGKVISFKITRSTWDSAEISADGSARDNRTYTVKPGEQQLDLTVANWDDLSDTVAPSTIVGEVIIEDISIPTYPETRKLRIYLPPDYHHSKASYPVIYIMDGQNVFDKKIANAGEWQIDEIMENYASTNKALSSIVVAIDHAGANRTSEYTPWNYPANSIVDGKIGLGDKFADYVALVLKPTINKRFRTKPQAKHSMVMGSSSGGLIALYIGVKHQQHFGRVAGLSSALLDDLIDDKMVKFIENVGKNADTKFYFDIGDQETGLMTESIFDDSQKVEQALYQAGFSHEQVNYKVIMGGVHNEGSWRERTPDIIEWLYKE